MENSSIKVGDKLAFRHSRGGWFLHTVTAITKTGLIRCGGYLLNPDLSMKAWEYYKPTQGYIPTPEIMSSIRKSELIQMIRDSNLTQLDVETLESIYKLIKGE